MKCPQDGSTLLITERQGVEIDYCPDCRGVWLDRGELDRLVDRFDDRGRGDRTDHRDDDRGRADRWSTPPKKKRNWLGEMFEFGD